MTRIETSNYIKYKRLIGILEGSLGQMDINDKIDLYLENPDLMSILDMVVDPPNPEYLRNMLLDLKRAA